MKKGMTIIEIIVASLVISVIAAGMFSAFIGTNYFLNRARHRIQAFNFAREACDRLKSDYSYADTQLDIGTGHLESEIGSIVRGTDMLNANTELTYDVSEPVTDGYKEIAITVTWDENNFE